MMDETKKAQRSKNSDLTILDYFRFFRETVPGKAVKRSQYFKIIRECNEIMVEDLIEGRTVLLPYLGKLRIEKYAASPQYKGIDYGHFNRTKEKVVRFRPHILDCYAPKLAWKRGLIPRPYCKDYTFKLVREVWRTRVLSKFKVEGGHKQYIEYI